MSKILLGGDYQLKKASLGIFIDPVFLLPYPHMCNYWWASIHGDMCNYSFLLYWCILDCNMQCPTDIHRYLSTEIESEGEVNKNGKGTIRDAYWRQHASSYVNWASSSSILTESQQPQLKGAYHSSGVPVEKWDMPKR